MAFDNNNNNKPSLVCCIDCNGRLVGLTLVGRPNRWVGRSVGRSARQIDLVSMDSQPLKRELDTSTNLKSSWLIYGDQHHQHWKILLLFYYHYYNYYDYYYYYYDHDITDTLCKFRLCIEANGRSERKKERIFFSLVLHLPIHSMWMAGHWRIAIAIEATFTITGDCSAVDCNANYMPIA